MILRLVFLKRSLLKLNSQFYICVNIAHVKLTTLLYEIVSLRDEKTLKSINWVANSTIPWTQDGTFGSSDKNNPVRKFT